MFIIGIFILGLITMLLWNALIPDLFHGPILSYWQALGLLVLTRVLVGIRGGGRRWKRWGWWGRRNRHNWKQAAGRGAGRPWWSDWTGQAQSADWSKWQGMSPEERHRMKEEWKAEFRKSWGSPQDQA